MNDLEMKGVLRLQENRHSCLFFMDRQECPSS